MTLQDFAKLQIIEFGGLDHFLDQMEKIKPLVPEDKLFHIDEMKSYWGLIFVMDLDMEDTYITYKDRAQSALDMFQEIYKKHGSLFAALMINILSGGFNKMGNVRNIS